MQNTIPPDLKEKIWRDMLTAELNHLYWGYLNQRFSSYERNTKIFLALTSSSTVASWGLWGQVDILWKVLSTISAVIAIASPFMNWQYSVEKTLELRVGWLEIQYEYEKLWRKIKVGNAKNNDIENSLDGIFNKLKPLSVKSADLPRDRKLSVKCQKEVLESRGLK